MNQTIHLQGDRFPIFYIRRTRFCIKADIVVAIRCILRHGNIECCHWIRIRLAIQPVDFIGFTILHSGHIVVAIDCFSFWSRRIIVMDDTVICKHRIWTWLCALLRYFKVISSSMGFFIYIQIQNKFLCNLGTLYRNNRAFLIIRVFSLTFCEVCTSELNLVRASRINRSTGARFYCSFIGYNSPFLQIITSIFKVRIESKP